LKKLPIEELLGTIKVHEIKLNEDEGQRKRRKNNSIRYTKEVKDKSQMVCYQCKKPEHFKPKCPSLEKEKEKDKKNPFFKNKKCLMET
ncbi:hypothetical protein CR513_29281, partial [Mucuna pruriens]